MVNENLEMNFESFCQKIAALACDGASVMTGCKGGEGALRKEMPSVITIHFMAHRLELALKDVAKSVPLYQKYLVLLKGL